MKCGEIHLKPENPHSITSEGFCLQNKTRGDSDLCSSLYPIEFDLASMPKILRYEYRWFNGVVLCDAHTDIYNRLLDEAQRYQAAGFDRAAEASHTERRTFLDTLFDFYLESNSNTLNV